MNRPVLLLLAPLLALALSACEQLGIDDPVKVAEKKDAEGRAVGSGCRHVGISLQECYDRNRKESKAAIFSGWREMDGYMRENKIDTVKAEGEEEEAVPAPKAEKTEKPAAPAKQTATPHGDTATARRT
jgi:hypothetical protein